VKSANLSILPWWFDRWYIVHTCLIKILMETSGMYICVECSTKFIFGILKTWKHISGHCSICLTKQYWKEFQCLQVYYRYMMYKIWNASFCQDDKNKRAIVQSFLIQILKESLVLSFCRVLPYVHFQCFGELKTRLHNIDPFTYIMNMVNIFDVLKNIIGM